MDFTTTTHTHTFTTQEVADLLDWIGRGDKRIDLLAHATDPRFRKLIVRCGKLADAIDDTEAQEEVAAALVLEGASVLVRPCKRDQRDFGWEVS